MLKQMGLKVSVEILTRTKIFMTIGTAVTLVLTVYLHFMIL
jgi:hypothetical protein